MTGHRSDGFPGRLRAALRRRQMTQADLADASGISARTLSFWMQHQRTPTLRSVEAVADVLNVNPGWLAFGIDEP